MFLGKTYNHTFLVASRRGKLSEYVRGVLESVNPELARSTAKLSEEGRIMCFSSLSEVSTGLVALSIKFQNLKSIFSNLNPLPMVSIPFQ